MARTGRKYLILDTETATLPFVNGMVNTVKDKRTLAIAKPLIYDIAWKVVDRNGTVYAEHSYLVNETFNVMTIFNTAYYKDKRPKYLERLKNKDTQLKNWNDIIDILLYDLERVDFVGAFNSMFDFKKAIPFTEKYINALYSPEYYEWEAGQKRSCRMILQGSKFKNEDWDGNNFNFRGVDYPLIDLWGIACEMLINTKTYKRKCLKYGMVTESGQFFKSSAETTFRYLCDRYDFEEMHMAIDDVNIECEILCKALKRGKITEGLQYFPFQMLGKTTSFILAQDGKRPIPVDEVATVINQIQEKLKTYEKESTFATTLERECYRLIQYLNERYRQEHEFVKMGYELRMKEIERREQKLQLEMKQLKTEKAIEKRRHELELLIEEYNSLIEKIEEI